ncbi:VOC family protein [Venturia nashicola]|nr:VOC family protein [Venturia nashicola]
MAYLLSLKSLVFVAQLANHVKSLPTAPSPVTGNVTAIGIGITSLDVSNKFYVSAFDFGKGSRMSFPTWEEDIMNPKNGGPALIPMKFKDERPVKNLPVKIQFAVPDPKATLARVVEAGGSAAEGMESKEGTVWGKDPDGYLLELVPSSSAKGAVLTGIGYGSSDVAKSVAFFSSIAGTTPRAAVKAGAWDISTVPTKLGFDIQFLDFHDTRPTKSLPLKIVFGAATIDGFKSTITANGGSLIKEIPAELSSIVGLGYDPVDAILMEVNPEGLLGSL